jgi:hypothetical protein
MVKVREEGKLISKGKVVRSVSSKRYMGRKRACREKKHGSQFIFYQAFKPTNTPTMARWDFIPNKPKEISSPIGTSKGVGSFKPC